MASAEALAALCSGCALAAPSLGNSAGIGMKHYVELVDTKAGREYWSIKPIRSTDRKIVAIA